MTSHHKWTDNTYRDIENIFVRGMTAILKWGQNLDSQSRRLARELLEALV